MVPRDVHIISNGEGMMRCYYFWLSRETKWCEKFDKESSEIYRSINAFALSVYTKHNIYIIQNKIMNVQAYIKRSEGYIQHM